MRNLNFLRKSERKSVGTTLALTVGSPSAHRRYSALKHLAFMLLFLLGSLNVWGDSPYIHEFTGSTTSPFSSAQAGVKSQTATLSGISWTITTAQAASYFAQTTTTGLQVGSKANQSGNFTLSTSGLNDYTITQVEVACSRAANSSAALSVTVGANALGTQSQSVGTASSTLTFSNQTGYSGDIVLSFANPTVSNKSTAVYIQSVTITYTTGGSSCETLAAPANPSSTPAQTSVVLSWDAVEHASGYKVVFNGTDYDIASGTTKTIEGLAMETEYHWTVAAKGDGTTYCAAGTATAQQSVTTLDACTANKAVYTLANKTSVTPSGALEGSTATFLNNGTNNVDQMTGGKSMTLTLSGYDGATIKGLTLSMHSNGSSGAGTFSLVIGSTTVAEISSAKGFDQWFDNTSFGTAYRNVHVPFDDDVVVGTGENIQVVIAASANSLYCQSFSFCYEEPAPAAVAKPTISGETPFLTSTTVTLACATDGATIYYTTDESDPKTSGTKQTGTSFTLYNSATVRAIANLGDDWSDEATSKTFTKIEPDYTTIAAFKAATPDTKKWVQFTEASNVVITGVNGKNVYVQDGNGNAICLYFANTNLCGSWTKAHKVTGMFQATYATYGNMPEMSIADGDENDLEAATSASMPEATEISTLAEATINDNMCKYVKLKGVHFQDQELDNNNTVDIEDASTNSLKFYDNLEMTKNGPTEYFDLPLTASSCNVYGVLISYKPKSAPAVNEILPVEAACIEAGDATLPTLSQAGSTDDASPTMVANGEAITVTPASGFTCTLNSASLTSATNVTISDTENNTEIAVSASRDYYATANATYYFKANPAGTKYAITVVQPAQGGTLEANFVETEAGNTVTLTATPTNSHFTFDGWVVKETGNPGATPETVTENQFTMPEYAVTVTGTFTEEDKATLTFAKGEADGGEAAPVNIEDYAGEVTLPACPFTYTGHYFIGWKKGETENVYQPGAYTITAADVTAGTVAFTAQWAAGYVFEWVADGHGYTNQEEISLVNSTPIEIEFAQGTASNAPKYFTNDKTARFYNGGTLTITAPTDYVISKIEFNRTDWGANANKGTLGGSTWTGLAEEVVFTATATSKVKSIKIYYKSGVAATLEIDDIEMEYNDVVNITPKTVTPAAAASHVGYQIKAGSDDCITLEDDQITAKSVTGTATIVATIPDAEGGEYIGTSIEFTVSVSAPDSRKKAKSPNAGFATISGDLNADIAYAAYQGDGTSTPNIKDAAIQLYQRGSGKASGSFVTFTAVKGCKIDQVKITTASKTTHIAYSVDDEALSATTENVTAGSDYLTDASLDATSVSIYCMHTSSDNRLFVANATVYYTGEPAELHHLKLSGEYPTVFDQGAAFSHEGLVVTACYDELETDTEVVTDQAIVSTPNMNVAGEQTITVSFGGKTAEYTITVNAAEGTDDLSGTWSLVTDAADLMTGMRVIIAQYVESDGAIYTMGDQKSNNRDAVASTVAGTTLAPNFRTRVFVLEDAGNGMFALKSEENGKYLYAAASSSNNLKSQDNVNDNAKWTISINEGVASIVATNSSNRNVMQFNSSLFSCYGSANQAAIALYARPFDYTRNVSGNYGTICLPKAGKIYGASLYEIAYYGATSKKIFFDEIVNGEMEAGIPYIFLPAAGAEKIGVYYSDNTAADVTAGNRNGLIGFYDLNNPAATQNITQDAGYYILYNNQYWLVSGRAAYVENYRAYIKLDQIDPSEPTLAPGRRRISMSVNDTQTATGIESAEANEAPRKVLINGELYILRGEKMYDAKGQLVK